MRRRREQERQLGHPVPAGHHELDEPGIDADIPLMTGIAEWFVGLSVCWGRVCASCWCVGVFVCCWCFFESVVVLICCFYWGSCV